MGALTGHALVVMPVVFPVRVPVMKIVDVVEVDQGLVAAAGAVGVRVLLGCRVLGRGGHCVPSVGVVHQSSEE
ncbi:hypothetical protein BH24ACT12_BH24ACT12_20960 [soil metagenome]